MTEENDVLTDAEWLRTVAEDVSRYEEDAQRLRRIADRLECEAGYVTAFYDLADMMGITAQPRSPKDVWEQQMRPRLVAMLSIVCGKSTASADVVERVARAIEPIVDDVPLVDAAPSQIRKLRAERIARAALSASPVQELVERLEESTTELCNLSCRKPVSADPADHIPGCNRARDTLAKVRDQ